MASIKKLPSGNWRVQIRRKGKYVAETFLRRRDADDWAVMMERRIDCGESISKSRPAEVQSIEDLINLHISDMREMRKPLRRSKAYSLEKLRTELGHVKTTEISRELLIEFGRDRSKDGAGPVTIAMDISYLKTIITHAAAVHGIETDIESIDLARVALSRLGLVGKAQERDRRPTQSELDDMIEFHRDNPRQEIPMHQIIPFAVATAMRQSEISSITWEDLDVTRRTIVVRDRKDPRNKKGNDQRVPLVDLTGYDAWEILMKQRSQSRSQGRIFPYNPRSVGTAFRRGCRELEIADLRFHDLRHEGTSRLFEAGLQIEQVALVTGHKDWKMLRRYTHISPDSIVRMASERKPRTIVARQ